MRLINIDTFDLEEFLSDNVPEYAILSHRWTNDEITYKDFVKRRKDDSPGFLKIQKFCHFVRSYPRIGCEECSLLQTPCVDHALKYAWIDTACIDKRSSSELSEAINSMWNWYRRASLCVAYIADFDAVAHQAMFQGDYGSLQVDVVTRMNSPGETTDLLFPRLTPSTLILSPCVLKADERSLRDLNAARQPDSVAFLASTIARSEWFLRGWTLQELLAPAEVVFCCQHWKFIGRRNEACLQNAIAESTGVQVNCLHGPHRGAFRSSSIAKKMSWAARRKTTRGEDMAYCLLGLFGVNIPLLYGEGEAEAFRRLQLELIAQSDDESLFAWPTNDQHGRALVSVLAPGPSFFEGAGAVEANSSESPGYIHRKPYFATHKGIQFEGLATHAWILGVRTDNVQPKQVNVTILKDNTGVSKKLSESSLLRAGDLYYVIRLNCCDVHPITGRRTPCEIIVRALTDHRFEPLTVGNPDVVKVYRTGFAHLEWLRGERDKMSMCHFFLDSQALRY